MKLNIVEIPKYCPACKTKLIHKDNNDGKKSTDIYCPNIKCPDRIKAHFKYVVGKGVFDIDGFGGATVEQLIDNHIISNWYDIFSLTANDLINKMNMTEYSAEKLIANITTAKENATGVTVLMSLGIDGIGNITAEKILNVYNDISTITFISNTSTIYDNLKPVIGDVAARNFITEFFNNTQVFMTIMSLKDAGISTTLSNNKIEVTSDKLKNIKMLASGTFDNFSRDEIKSTIEKHGGIYASGVNKKLDILICGKNIGPSKLEKATKLGIKMINEEEFLKMIN